MRVNVTWADGKLSIIHDVQIVTPPNQGVLVYIIHFLNGNITYLNPDDVSRIDTIYKEDK